MKKIIGTMIGIGLLLLSSCAVPTPAPTPTPTSPPPTPTAVPITTVEELLGIWQRGATQYYLQFKGDGIYRAARSPEALEDAPWFEGEFWFEGGQLLLKDTASIVGWQDCVGLPAGAFEVQGAVEDYLTFVAIDDPCEDRSEGLPNLPFRWFSP